LVSGVPIGGTETPTLDERRASGIAGYRWHVNMSDDGPRLDASGGRRMIVAAVLERLAVGQS
jgi:hypothetical protein